MNLLQRIRLVSAADPFVPFTIRDSGGMAWPIEARECLTVNDSGDIVEVMSRRPSPHHGWRHADLRSSQLISLEWSEDQVELAADTNLNVEDRHDGPEADGHR